MSARKFRQYTGSVLKYTGELDCMLQITFSNHISINKDQLRSDASISVIFQTNIPDIPNKRDLNMLWVRAKLYQQMVSSLQYHSV